jgi:hypothetical protein
VCRYKLADERCDCGCLGDDNSNGADRHRASFLNWDKRASRQQYGVAPGYGTAPKNGQTPPCTVTTTKDGLEGVADCPAEYAGTGEQVSIRIE